MKQNKNIFELKNYNQNQSKRQSEIQSIPQNVLPNVLNLLGQPQRSNKSFSLPTYSIFYISPVSQINLIYNSMFMIAFYIIEVQLPMIMAFGSGFSQNQFRNFGFNFMYWFIFAFLILDIFISFHKGYYQYGKGRVCEDQRKITNNYLKNQIYFDVLVIGFMIVPQASYNQAVNFLTLIPLILLWIKKSKYKQQIINILQYKKIIRIIFQLFILFIDVLLIGHIGSCIFLVVDIVLWNNQYYGSSTSYYWLSNNTSYNVNLMEGPWYFQYIYAQSFSTGSLSTLAPGPFAKNPIQVVYAIFVMIYFMLLASYVGQLLISILYSEQIKRVFHEQNIQDFDKYMQLKRISQHLKTRIYNFFELIWDAQSRLQSEQQKVAINLLPLNLKQQLLLEMSFANSFFLFKYIEDSKVLKKQMALKINRVIFDSDTCLFKQGNQVKKKNDQNFLTIDHIYHLSRGMVKYYISLDRQQFHSDQSQTSFFNKSFKSNQNLILDKQKDFFSTNQFIMSFSNSDKFIGLYQFITRKSFHYCCKAVDLCQFDMISRKDFMQILRYTQNEQLYHKIKHEIIYYNRINIINKICSICLQNHIEELCPSINYHERVKIQLIWRQHNIGRRQMRTQKLGIRDKKRFVMSRKLLMRQAPVLKKKAIDQKNIFLNIFDEILLGSNIRMQQLLLQIGKQEEIQQCKIWRSYYPEDNVDRINYMMGKSREGVWEGKVSLMRVGQRSVG